MIIVQQTPNPNALKFIVPTKWINFVWECVNEKDAAKSSLAKELWNLGGVKYLMFGSDFVSINKSVEIEWNDLQGKVLEVIDEFLSKDRGLFEDVPSAEWETKAECAVDREFTEFEHKLIQTINEKVQPVLASHGGMVKFIGFDDGIVTLDMQGACRGCPSSQFTLQNGIQNLLGYYFPEVKKVVSL